ncbi:MAG TPA: HlyD family secretion protein [Draconibacterium sp.]|nr:HlyD family secretion protein [Draconibacterium sp.]
MKENKRKNGLRVYFPLIIVIAMVAFGSYYWYREYKKYISTDDAFVDTDNVSVSAKMLGRIVHIYADEGDIVKAGELITELDSSDLQSQKARNVVIIEQAKANLLQARAKLRYDEENIKVLEVNDQKAQDDFKRASEQFKGGVITEEQFSNIKSAGEAIDAKLKAAKTALDVSRAGINTAKTAVESAKAQLQVIETQLKNTKLYAPIDGIVAKRWLLPGDIVQPGQSIFTITNNKKLWLTVYLEETKIAAVQEGQDARFTIDAYPGISFTGKVFSIGSNTASQFSLIPPNNASGNFTKVTQRVPLKISIDGTEGNGNLSSFHILAGMSAVVKIIKEKQ